MSLWVEAIRLAEEVHRGQKKSGDIPYLYHPLAVASLVLRYGGSEAQACAALVHDVIGDPRGARAELERKLGVEVARLAYAFADPELPPEVLAERQGDWRGMKAAYLEKLLTLSEQELLVVGCEELHEGTELLQDLKRQGGAAWARFKVAPGEVFWYFREILRVMNARMDPERNRALLASYAEMLRALREQVFEGGGRA